MVGRRPLSLDDELNRKLLASLANIVEGVLRTPEIIVELDANRLRSEDILDSVLRDRFFLSRARGKYKTVIDRAEEIAQHEKARPNWLSGNWTLDRRQIAYLSAAIIWPFVYTTVLFEVLLSWSSFITILALVADYHFDPITRWFLKKGLPKEIWARLQWGRHRRVLRLGLPVLHYDWKQGIRDELVLPEVREKINDAKKPVFDHTLSIRDASGLQSTDDLAVVIETRAIKALIREISRLRCGAIALAGPRGIGKTTLIRAMAADMLPLESSLPRLTITAAAPSRYEPRDFVLHLYALVCKTILDLLTFYDLRQSSTGVPYERWEKLRRRIRRREMVKFAIKRIRNLLSLALITLITASVTWYGDPRRLPLQAKMDVRRLAPPPWSHLPSFFLHVPLRHAIGTGILVIGGLFTALGLISLCIRMILAIGIQFIRVTARRGPRTPLREIWRSSRTRSTVYDLCAYLFTIMGLEHLKPKMPIYPDPSEQLSGAARRELRDELAALRLLAEEQLREIRFLQTRTTGWSGKLTGTRGLEIGWQNSIQRAERPLTHPEVVEQFRIFLARAAQVLAGLCPIPISMLR